MRIALREIDFLFKKVADRFNVVTIVDITWLNTDMCKSELLQSEESRT